MSNPITFIDFFAGIGGFRKGLENAGHKCVGFCEWDKFATMSYISMHLLTDKQREYLSTLDFKKRQKEILNEKYLNGEWYCDDVQKVNSKNIPKADCYCFGAPCQDFSIAGNRAGLEGDRSSLVREIFRIVREQDTNNRPEWLIYENVKGMLSSNRGLDFLAILLEMDELGYDIEWQTFNTRYFGIPQNRERIYTIGHLRTRGSRKLFPFKNTNRKDSISKINIIGHRDGYRRNTQVFDPNGTVEAIDTGTGGGRGHHTIVPLGMLRNVRNDYAKSIRKDYENGNIEAKRSDLIEKEIRTDNISNTIDTVQKDNLLAIGINNVGSISKGQNGNVYGVDGVSPTLRSGQGITGNGIGSNNSPKVAIPINNDITTVKLSFSKGMEETDVSPTLMARNYKGIGKQMDIPGVAVHIPVMTPEKENKRANGRRFKDNEEPSFTLTTIDRHGVAIGVEPISSVYLSESDTFASSFTPNVSKTLKASNDVGAVVVDISQEDKDLAETIISDKYTTTENKSKLNKNKSLFSIKSNRSVGEQRPKTTKGLYVKLNENTTVYCIWYEKYQQYIAIRKLTPRENFRLQGWSDNYFEKAKFINSDSQLYKQAGNGVTVQVVEEIGNAIYKLE